MRSIALTCLLQVAVATPGPEHIPVQKLAEVRAFGPELLLLLAGLGGGGGPSLTNMIWLSVKIMGQLLAPPNPIHSTILHLPAMSRPNRSATPKPSCLAFMQKYGRAGPVSRVRLFKGLFSHFANGCYPHGLRVLVGLQDLGLMFCFCASVLPPCWCFCRQPWLRV